MTLSVTDYLQYFNANRSQDDQNFLQNNASFGNFSFENINRNGMFSEVLANKIDLLKGIRNLRNQNAAVKADFFAPFVDKYWELHKVYTVSLQSYKHAIANGQQAYDETILLEIVDKMIMAAVFEAAICKDQYSYQEQLKVLEQVFYEIYSKNPQNKEFLNLKEELELYEHNIPKPSTVAAEVRKAHEQANPARFFILRSWRSINMHFVVIFASCKVFIDGLNAAKAHGLGIFFSYLAWVFFIPRFIVNLLELLRVLFGSLPIFAGLSDLEKEYGLWRRLKFCLKEIGFQLANDSMWISAGIITCFSLAGSLPIIGIYIMLAAQAYDLFVMLIRNYFERDVLNTVQDVLKNIKENKKKDYPEHFLTNLGNRIAFDEKVLLYAICNFALLLMCVALMTSGFASINPFIPLIAGLVTVIAALFRGFFVSYFSAQAKELDPALIDPNKHAGLVVLRANKYGLLPQLRDIESICEEKSLFGPYKKGLVLVGPDSFSGYSLYMYDASRDKILTLFKEYIKLNDGSDNDLSAFINKYSTASVGQRAIRISDAEYTKIANADKSGQNSVWSGVDDFLKSLNPF